MPRFPNDSLYSNVNEIADREGLLWDGQYGSPYDIGAMIHPDRQDAAVMRQFAWLFDHTKRFKPRGEGREATGTCNQLPVRPAWR